jgi:2-oxoglutarate ferredoxin oxidoreductase subunit delta
MSKIEIDELRCKGCGLCTITCPKGLIDLSGKINNLGYTPATYHPSRGTCTGCTLCAEICPDVAIDVFKQ